MCLSTDPRDKRLRPSILVRYDNRNILIDTTPDFRQQILRTGIERLDAILYTHAHADHILGLDDVRPFNYRQREPIPLYATPEVLAVISPADERLVGYLSEAYALRRYSDALEKLRADEHGDSGLFGTPD